MKRREKRCSQCHNKLEYNNEHDSYFCARCVKWSEKKCGDKGCSYCINRPDSPLTLLYLHYASEGLRHRDQKNWLFGNIIFERDVNPNHWLLLDIDNGNPECGHGYVWIFPTKTQAIQHRDEQNNSKKKYRAELRGPWRVKDCTIKFLRDERFK